MGEGCEDGVRHRQKEGGKERENVIGQGKEEERARENREEKEETIRRE